MGRPRFDLDGIPLHGEGSNGMVLAILRHRTTDGLDLLMPESGNFTVPWSLVRNALIDLPRGEIRIEFDTAFAAKENWLRGNDTLVGTWMDRHQMGPST